jgi:hypothetical protein
MEYFLHIIVFKVRKAHSCPKAYSLSWWNAWISPKETICVRGFSILHCLPTRVELVFERTTSCNVGFSKWCLALFLPNRPIQVSWWSTCICPTNTTYVRSRSLQNIVSVWDLNYCLKGIFLKNHSFQGVEMFILFLESYSSIWRSTCISQ